MDNPDNRSPTASRRTFLAGAAALGVAAPSLVRAQSSQRIVYANWGGSWEAAMKKAWWEPFTKETGIQVVGATGNTLGRLQAMGDAKRVERLRRMSHGRPVRLAAHDDRHGRREPRHRPRPPKLSQNGGIDEADGSGKSDRTLTSRRQSRGDVVPRAHIRPLR